MLPLEILLILSRIQNAPSPCSVRGPAYEISKSYRVCLDARNLNNLTADEIVCSPNPDTMISELMFMNPDQSNLETNKDLISNVPEELLEYLNSPISDSEDDQMFLYYVHVVYHPLTTILSVFIPCQQFLF